MAFLIVTEPIPLKADIDGVVRIGGTRVTLDTVVAAFNEGATAKATPEPSSPGLTAEGQSRGAGIMHLFTKKCIAW